MFDKSKNVHCNLALIGMNSYDVRAFEIIHDKSSGNIQCYNDIKDILDGNAICLIKSFDDNISVEYLKQIRFNDFIWNPVVILSLKQSTSHFDELYKLWILSYPPTISEIQTVIANIYKTDTLVYSDIQRLLRCFVQDVTCLVNLYNLPANNTIGYSLINSLNSIATQIESLTIPCVNQYSSKIRNHISELEEKNPALYVLDELGNTLDQLSLELLPYDVSDSLFHQIHHLRNNLSYSRWLISSCINSLRRIRNFVNNAPLDLVSVLSPNAKSSIFDIYRVVEPFIDHSAACCDERIIPLDIDNIQEPLARLRHMVTCYSDDKLDCCNYITKIVVIEDNEYWQLQLRTTLTAYTKSVKVEIMHDMNEAIMFLSRITKTDDRCLVLVDLGLPTNISKSNDEIKLDAGLDIIRKFGGHNKLKFIVLTAAHNYEQIVRECLIAGVEPSDYIHKDPYTWESQLRSRVELALRAPRSCEPPIVEIFKSSTKIARIDGVEVVFDRKPYILLSYLASRSRAWCEVDTIRSALTQPGPNDLTPVMSKELLRLMIKGASYDPFDLLTPKHIQDYLHDIRKTVRDAFKAIGRPNDAPDLVAYDSDLQAYRLLARTKIYESFSEIAAPPAPVRVMVVEDHSQWSEAITARLTSLSLAVCSVSSLKEFKNTIGKWVPDIVTLDMQLPQNQEELEGGVTHERNGIAVLHFLRQHYPEIRIVVHTAIAWNDAVMLEVLKEGVFIDDYLDKRWINSLDRMVHSVWRLSNEIQRGSRIPSLDIPDQVVSVSLTQGMQNAVSIGGKQITLSAASGKVFRMLAASPNMPVDREAIIDVLWEADDIPDTFEENLNTIVSRLRKEITDKTNGAVDGKKLIRSADGVYWLYGVFCT